MKAIAISVLAFAVITATVIAHQVAAKPRAPVAQAEWCVGLSCWPPDWPTHREILPPVW